MKTFFGVLISAAVVGLFVVLANIFQWFGDYTTLAVAICLIVLACAVVLVCLTAAQREEYGAEFDMSMVVSIGMAVLSVIGLIVVGIIVVIRDSDWYVAQFMLAGVIYVASTIMILIGKSQDYPEFLTFASCGTRVGAILYATVVGIIVIVTSGIAWYGICFLLAGAIIIAASVINLIATYNYNGEHMMLATLLSGVAYILFVVVGAIEVFGSWEPWAAILSTLGASAFLVFDLVLSVGNNDYVSTGARNN